MSLKQDVLAALRSGADHQVLIELVARYQAQGLTPRKTYDELEQLWLELGFDKVTDEGPVQQELEYVMERVWYQGTP